MIEAPVLIEVSIKEQRFQDKCDTIAAALVTNLFEEIKLHHGNTKLARGIARSVVMSMYEIDY